PEVAVGHSRDSVGGHEVLEFPQVRTQRLRRNSGVLPARPRLVAFGGSPGESRAVGTDPPERSCFWAGRDDPHRGRSGSSPPRPLRVTGVPPARPRLVAFGGAPGESRAVGTDPPERSCFWAGRNDPHRGRSGISRELPGARVGGGLGFTGDFHE